MLSLTYIVDESLVLHLHHHWRWELYEIGLMNSQASQHKKRRHRNLHCWQGGDYLGWIYEVIHEDLARVWACWVDEDRARPEAAHFYGWRDWRGKKSPRNFLLSSQIVIHEC